MRFTASILSAAGIMDKTANNSNRNSGILKSDVLNFRFGILKLFRNSDLEIRNFAANHFKNMIAASILQVLKLSKSAVKGRARNMGMDLMNKTTASSRGARRTYAAKPATR